MAQSVGSYAWSAPERTTFVGVREDVVAAGARNVFFEHHGQQNRRVQHENLIASFGISDGL